MSSTKKNELPRAWIIDSESCVGGETINPEDDWPDHEPTYKEVEFKGLYKTQPKKDFFCHSVEIEPSLLNLDYVYMVVARYSTGDTFGTTHGNWCVFSICATEEEAKKDEIYIRESVNKKDIKCYHPWIGYYEELEDVEIHHMPFQQNDNNLVNNIVNCVSKIIKH